MNAKTPAAASISNDDIETCLTYCTQAFAQLEALLHVIKQQAPEHSITARLASLGEHLACEMENQVDCILEQLPAGDAITSEVTQ